MILEYDIGSPFECIERLFFVLQHLLHLLLPFFHIFADLLQRFLLSLYQIQAKLKNLGIVGSKVLPKSFFVALHSVIGEYILFNLLV